MLDGLFSAVISTSSGVTVGSFALCLATALALGALLAWVYTYKSACSRSFVFTLATLPAVVSVVIMMVSGNLGAGVAVAGTFSLVRFRSAPGTAREIGAVFLSMAVGLACGMGCCGFVLAFTLVMAAVSLLYTRINFGVKGGSERRRALQITVPEGLDYCGAFDDLFEKYTVESRLTRVKTTNLGSLNRLSYDIMLRTPGSEKEFIDALRCRNGNLEISCALRGDDGEL